MNKTKTPIIIIALVAVIATAIIIISSLTNGNYNSEEKISAIQTGNISTDQGYTIYRGVVENINEDFLLVQQVKGFNYGEEEIQFNISDSTILETNDITLEKGHYVEVQFNSALTHSIPPQATANKIILISSFGKDTIQNGEIISTRNIDSENISVEIFPFDKNGNILNNQENRIILLVPVDSLEIIQFEELKKGTLISAVTKGIATNSIPPQYPVTILLPFNNK